MGERSLIVEHGRADGELKETKTRRIRTVGLLAPVADDLDAWRAKAPRGGALIFPRNDGAVFRDTDYRNWRKREFDPAAAAAGAGGATPYTLRHSFASLLVRAGWNALEIAVEMGNRRHARAGGLGKQLLAIAEQRVILGHQLLRLFHLVVKEAA